MSRCPSRTWQTLSVRHVSFPFRARKAKSRCETDTRDALDECKNDAAKLGLFSSVLGHVGDGNFHQMIMYNPNKPEEAASVKDFIDSMMHKAIKREGTVSVST